MGRPKGSKNKPKVLKSPFKKVLMADEEVLPDVVKKVRYLGGMGLNPNHIATLAGVPLEDVSPGGKYWPDVEKGAAEAILAVAQTHYARVLSGKSTQEVMFYLRSVGKFADTPDGRRKVAAESGTSDEFTGMDIEFDDNEYDPNALGEGEEEADEDMGEFEI